MHIFVGSTNPVKINAVIAAASEQWPEVEVAGFEVASGIPEQPWGDEQTLTGATNRARAALAAGQAKNPGASEYLGVGLEGGVIEFQGNIWSTVWVSVVDSSAADGAVLSSNGARFMVPETVAAKLRAGGEMGPVMSELCSGADIKRTQGMIGIVTNGFVDRTEEYAGIAKLALGLWFGRGWEKELKG